MNIKDATVMMKVCAAFLPKSQEAQYLKLGKWFSQRPLTRAEAVSMGRKLKDIHQFQAGECYMNAAKIAMAEIGFTFCEGMAAGYWPVPHAWVEYRGRAIDVTWHSDHSPAITSRQIMQRVKRNLRNCIYFGIEVPTPILRDHIIECETWSPLFDCRFSRKWPEYERVLTTGKFPGILTKRGNNNGKRNQD